MKRVKYTGVKSCWHCGNRFRTKKGGGYTFATIRDPIGAELRVHKDCVRNVIGDGYTEVRS